MEKERAMAVCTFFGHSDTPQQVAPILRVILSDLIENKNVKMFYVGNHGNVDCMVRNTLRLLKLDYPDVDYAVVLAYMPHKKNIFDSEDYSDTIYPEGLEYSLPKYSITKRNQWMLGQSDYVITYITHSWGGAAQFKELAKKQGKIVVNLAEFV